MDLVGIKSFKYGRSLSAPMGTRAAQQIINLLSVMCYGMKACKHFTPCLKGRLKAEYVQQLTQRLAVYLNPAFSEGFPSWLILPLPYKMNL